MQTLDKRFMERVSLILPKEERALFFENCTRPLPKVVRIAPLKEAPSPIIATTLSEVGEMKIQNIPEGWILTPTAIPGAYFIDREEKSLPLGKTMEHFCGKIYIQSLSSMLPVLVLNPMPGDKVLDMCAAPGSKSTFMAEKMENSGTLVCNELSSSRSKKLVANINRLGVLNSVVTQNNGFTMSTYFDQEFDKILLDAPCSSEGFGRKDSKFFSQMWDEKKIFEAAKLQRGLICSAFEMLRPGGEMVYSTCTTAPEENELVVEHLLTQYREAVEIVSVDEYSEVLKGKIPYTEGTREWSEQNIRSSVSSNSIRIWPHKYNKEWDSECFYLIKIRKVRALRDRKVVKSFSGLENKKMRGKTLELVKKNQKAEYLVRWEKDFGIPRKAFTGKELVRKEEGSLWLMTRDCFNFVQKNRYQRVGVEAVDKHGNFTSEFAIHFGRLATKQILALTVEEKDRWLAGYDLVVNQPIGNSDQKLKGNENILFVHFEGFCLGWGKVMNESKLKNKLNRDLVF